MAQVTWRCTKSLASTGRKSNGEQLKRPEGGPLRPLSVYRESKWRRFKSKHERDILLGRGRALEAESKVSGRRIRPIVRRFSQSKQNI